MSAPLTAGFIPLVDAAPLIVAREIGFAEEEGLDLTLAAAPSWSTLRDQLMLEPPGIREQRSQAWQALATRVADANIRYVGKGEIARASQQGWLQRFFSIISPF